MSILCGQFDSLPVVSETTGYVLRNNAWGYGTTYNGNQCIINDDGAPDFTVVQSTADAATVMGYPNISYGCSLFGTNKTSGSKLPVKLAGLGPIISSWSTAQSAVSGSKWDTTYDCWITSQWPGQQYRVAEIMIMLTYPSTPNASVVKIGTNEFYLSKSKRTNSAGLTWNLVQFRYVIPQPSVTDLNLTPFFEYVVKEGWASPQNLLTQIAAGFELWVNGQGLSTLSFSVQ